jgi:YbbR domain-containing protein
MAYHPFRHLGLKVLALALATLLWLTVAGQHVAERMMRVPLEFHNTPAGLEIVGEPPTSVDVRVRGASGLISRLDPGDVAASVDLASARPGSRLIPVEGIRAPYGVEITQIVPATISLDLEKSATRSVPVVPAIDGDPAPGFIVGPIRSDPANVKVIGPETRIRQLTEATTEPVNVAGMQERVRDTVTVGVADSAVRLADPVTAKVVVDILPAPVERDLTGVPVRMRNLPSGLRAQVTPSLAAVSVRGQRHDLDGLRSDAIDAFVDLAGLGPGHYNLRVQIAPSQQFGVKSLNPSVVDVIIK